MIFSYTYHRELSCPNDSQQIDRDWLSENIKDILLLKGVLEEEKIFYYRGTYYSFLYIQKLNPSNPDYPFDRLDIEITN